MDISLTALTGMGKEAMEQASRSGHYFFPKVAYSVDGQIRVATYGGAYEEFEILLQRLSVQPLEWLANTVDSYYLLVKKDDVDNETLRRYEKGTTLKELFEEGDPDVVEAMTIVKVGPEGKTATVTLPYLRHGRRIEWLDEIGGEEAESLGGRFVEVMQMAVRRSRADDN